VAALLEAKPRAAARGNMGIEGSSSDPLDDVQLQLLLGKVYSEWKGHSGDAITVYNGLIDEYKQDFRGFLAKGSLLKEIGKVRARRLRSAQRGAGTILKRGGTVVVHTCVGS
jgi:hypothetical protein